MTSTNTVLTEDEMRARIADLRPKYGLPLRTAYSALLQLYDALDSVAEAEEANNALMGEADEAFGLSGDVMEGTGSSEFFDVVAAIQALAQRRTNSDVTDAGLIPVGLAQERMEQLEPSPPGWFDGPDDLAGRLTGDRRENRPMPQAGETTIRRLLSADADPDSIASWVFPRSDRAGSVHERLDQLELELHVIRELAERLAGAVGVDRSCAP